jgi:hypothetical protein
MSNMQDAYTLAAATVRQRFEEQCPDHLKTLNAITERDVAVYAGSFDSVENVLKSLSVNHTMNPPPAKSRAKIHFGNCSSTHDKGLVDGLKAKVEHGAWLVTSDWALASIVQQAFPNTIRRREGKNTGDEVVGVEPVTDSCWSEVVVLGVDPQWWLEGSSYPIEVVNPNIVRIEAASHEMLTKYDAPVVAASFDWAAGHVFHVISHFWLKRSRTPHTRYAGPCEDFLRVGMRLSEDGIQTAIRKAKVDASKINFAMIQSAATATELVAQLCVRAMGEARA